MKTDRSPLFLLLPGGAVFLVARAHAMGVEMPIAAAMADLLSGALPLGEAVLRLMSRPLKTENK